MSARRRRFVERSSSALSLVRARLGRARGLGAAAGLLLGPGALDAARDGGAPALEEPGQRRVAIREARDASNAVAVPRRDLGKRRRRERFARPGVRDGVARADLEDRKPGLTVTSTRPAMAAPNSIITHSGMLGAQIATRSPGWKRDLSARAVRRDCSCSSR